MKHFIFTISALLLIGTAVQAQAEIVEYQSMLQEGRVWVNHLDVANNTFPEESYSKTYSYELHGDSLLNGFSYKKCYLKSSKKLDPGVDVAYAYLTLFREEPVALLREEGMKVYVKLCDFPYQFASCEYELDDEFLAYDFGYARENSPLEYTITQEYVNDVPCNHYVPTDALDLLGVLDVEMLESVGACSGIGTLLFPAWITLAGYVYDYSGLSYVMDDKGQIIYKGKGYREPTYSDIVDINIEQTGDNHYYNLQGQRVDNPTPGIYIHGGKKVAVK